MKTSNKSSIITGVVLLALAALFSISLIIQPLDFGYGGPGHNNIFFLIGNILYTVYGFSSILIPVFLLISGLSCFATIWTARKTMLLLTAVIPFFTAVITENICRSILAISNGSFTAVKLVITIITGLLLIAMEFLGTGIIADKVNEKLFYSNKKTEPKDEAAEENPSNEDVFTFVDETPSASTEDASPEVSETPAQDETTESSEPTVFDSALDEVKIETPEPVTFPEDKEFTQAIQTLNNFITDEDMNISEAELQRQEKELGLRNEITVTEPEEVSDNGDRDNGDNGDRPQSELSQDKGDRDNGDSPLTEPSAEKASEQLVETTQEKTEDEEEVNPATIISQEEYAALTKFDEPEQTPVEDELEWPDLPPTPDVLPPEYDEDYNENDPSLEFPPKEEVPEFDLTKRPVSSANTEPVFSSPKYEDKVVENPAYPHGISLFDDAAEENSVEENQEVKKSKFPSKISFGDEEEEEVQPDFSITPAYTLKKQSEQKTTISLDENNFGEPSLEEEIATFDSFNDEAESEETPEDNNIFDQIAVQEETETDNVGFASAASNVFNSMEDDIRSQTPAIEHHGANNLTADELSDFFNAQQEENTPKTKAIAANPPKIGSRAAKKGPYVIPSDLLIAYKDDQYWIIDEATKQASLNLKQTLAEFNIEADIIGIKKGPVVTMFEILPAPGVKLSKIVALQDNIALSLAAQSVRIVAPIPGKQAVGIEVPNKHRSVVGFREIIEMDLPDWKKMAVPVILGKDILGKAQLIDLAKTPHMLIAGATGSGKSVCVNSLILSILYKRSPQDVKMILVDPKVVELKLYNNIPHLLTPVITEPKKALQSLQWCLCEMERRYALLDGMGVRDISNYNTKIKEQKIATEKLPYIVVIIDEFADLMATSGKELENVIARLTAMSRAVGIHLVLATQRPSVNVITGLIKANIPTRIAFMVASRTDSNIIVDTVGAEKLLGRGDMLYASAADPAPIRIQGTFVTDQECEDVINAVKEYGEPDYIDDEIFFEDDEERATDLFGQPMDDDDPLYDQALNIVVQEGKASASYLQRRLKIGYNRAARLVEEMEERGIVGPANGSKPRDVIHIPN